MKKKCIFKTINYISIPLFFTFGILASCSVHESPDIEEEIDKPLDSPADSSERIPFVLYISCETQPSIYEEINYATRMTELTVDHDQRYIVNIYKSNDGENFTNQADTTIIYTKQIDDEQNHSIRLNLTQGFYDFIVWSDYVDKGTDNDKYYNTVNFAEITYLDRENYEGCNILKDILYGTVRTTVAYDSYLTDDDIVEQEATVYLERPLAKYKFISTDLIELSDPVNFDNYQVVFYYTGFMPCSFNAFTNQPCNSWESIYFNGKITPLTENEIELGFDYIFVSGEESKHNIAMEIYNKNGDLINNVVIEVPLARGKLTIVRGNFFTLKNNNNDIIINPDYDGDINIEIP